MANAPSSPPKPASYCDPTALTPSEIKSLRAHKRHVIAVAHREFARMEAEERGKATKASEEG